VWSPASAGSGKTVAARAALGALDGSRHTTIYMGAPGVGLRGMYAAITWRWAACPVSMPRR